MNGELIKVHLDNNSFYEDQRIAVLKKKAVGLPKLFHCDCCRSIAKFYLLELEYAKRRQPVVITKEGQKDKVKFTEIIETPRFWNDAYENYYTREFSEVAAIILRFTLCAALGEARHTIHSVSWDESEEKTKEIKKETYDKLRVMFGSLGWKHIPSERNSVYRVYTPERLWWKLFAYTKDIFGVDNWSSAFGGVAWKQGVELAMKAYKAICLAERANIVIWLDTLINHCHNGGLMLNKFNCGGAGCSYFSIKTLLDTKHTGDLNCLTEVESNTGCECYVEGTCNSFVLLAPTDD